MSKVAVVFWSGTGNIEQSPVIIPGFLQIAWLPEWRQGILSLHSHKQCGP